MSSTHDSPVNTPPTKASDNQEEASEPTHDNAAFTSLQLPDFIDTTKPVSQTRIPALPPIDDDGLNEEDEAQDDVSPSRLKFKPEHFINRELSWLDFNWRVLEMALDEDTPILERLKFLCISSSNLDEFFEVRVARLMQQARMDAPRTGPDKMTPEQQLKELGRRTQRFVAEQYRILNDVLIPKLEQNDIHFVRRSRWNDAQRAWVADYFHREVLPVLSPIGLDPAHPFPRILNKSLNFIVSLKGEDAFGRESGIAVVQAPRSLPRLIQMPEEVAGGPNGFVFLSSVIHAHVGKLFEGMQVRGCYQFRVTRNAELFVDEEEIEDLLIALEDELYDRNYGDAVRLEVADNCPMEVARFLLDHFHLTEENLFQVNGPVNLKRLMMIPGAVSNPKLKYPPLVQENVLKQERYQKNIFSRLREVGDVLMHHPFHSFSTVTDFIRQAAADPDVLAIKQTLYRTELDSPMVTSLLEAAKSGKEVTAVIELRARFDEERNIKLASRFQAAGAHVVYGVVGYKTHAKMTLVVRRESHGLQRYIHLGTGNYHPSTAKLYTDFGLLSANDDLGEDVHKMFQQLTGLGRVVELHHALQAPFSLHSTLIESIHREIEHARQGRQAHIMAKMNSLTEVEVIKALYEASNAGVKVDLIIRGICRLRPGVPGLSEHIHVRSIVGRFLEHTRVYYFANDGAHEVYCASADWMTRNLKRRVEAAFPLLDPALKQRVIEESFDVYLRDNKQAWELGSDGTYTRVKPTKGQPVFNAQEALMKKFVPRDPVHSGVTRAFLIPQKPS